MRKILFFIAVTTLFQLLSLDAKAETQDFSFLLKSKSGQTQMNSGIKHEEYFYFSSDNEAEVYQYDLSKQGVSKFVKTIPLPAVANKLEVWENHIVAHLNEKVVFYNISTTGEWQEVFTFDIENYDYFTIDTQVFFQQTEWAVKPFVSFRGDLQLVGFQNGTFKLLEKVVNESASSSANVTSVAFEIMGKSVSIAMIMRNHRDDVDTLSITRFVLDNKGKVSSSLTSELAVELYNKANLISIGSNRFIGANINQISTVSIFELDENDTLQIIATNNDVVGIDNFTYYDGRVFGLFYLGTAISYNVLGGAFEDKRTFETNDFGYVNTQFGVVANDTIIFGGSSGLFYLDILNDDINSIFEVMSTGSRQGKSAVKGDQLLQPTNTGTNLYGIGAMGALTLLEHEPLGKTNSYTSAASFSFINNTLYSSFRPGYSAVSYFIKYDDFALPLQETLSIYNSDMNSRRSLVSGDMAFFPGLEGRLYRYNVTDKASAFEQPFITPAIGGPNTHHNQLCIIGDDIFGKNSKNAFGLYHYTNVHGDIQANNLIWFNGIGHFDKG